MITITDDQFDDAFTIVPDEHGKKIRLTEGAAMTRTTSTVKVADIPSIIDDPGRGVVSLVGDHGGLSLVVGDVEPSGLVMGTIAFETEHGTVYLDPEGETAISEDDGQSMPVDDLYFVNDTMTALLAHFEWQSGQTGQEKSDDEALNELTHSVGGAVLDLLAQTRSEG